MEPTTGEKNGQNQEDRQGTEPNSNKPRKLGEGRYMVVSALSGILILAAVLTVLMIRHRETGIMVAGIDYHEAIADNKIHTSYPQHDTRWSSNPLGSLKDIMGSSGCLTSCIAAPLTVQGVRNFSSGELNQIFNENKAYNDHGAIVWKELGQALSYARARLDCGTTSGSINRLLDEKMYPIVKIKYKSGAVHWIMLMGTEKDTPNITAMDPIGGSVHMSNYDNRIYGIRVVTGSGRSSETTGGETEASGKPHEVSGTLSGQGQDKTGKTEDRDTAAVTDRAEEGFWRTEEAFAQKEIQPVSLEELGKAPDTQGIVLLSALPQNKFHLYDYAGPAGYYDGIYIMDWEGNMNSFPPIPHTSPQLILPRMGWDQENDVLKASFHTMTGTSLSREQFYAFLRHDTGHLEPYESREEDYEKQLDRRLSYKLDKEKNMVTFYDESEKIVSLPLGDSDSSHIRDVIYTDLVVLNPNQPVTMAFTPGFIIGGVTTPQYLEQDVRLEAAIDVIRDSDSSEVDVVRFHIRDIEKGGS